MSILFLIPLFVSTDRGGATTTGFDVCGQYMAQYVIDQGGSLAVGRRTSFCNQNELCDGLPISCYDAFSFLVSRQFRLVEIPPIVAEFSQSETQRILQSERESRSTSDNILEITLMTLRPFRDMQRNVEFITRRINSQIPLLVFSEAIDGDFLRQIIASATQLSKISETVLEIVHRASLMRKWAWSIQLLMDSLVFSGVSIRDTRLRLVGMAPFVHAFLHATFILRIYYPSMFMDPTSWDFIHTIIKYHPQYTLSGSLNDDGVWYIRTPLNWRIAIRSTPIQLDISEDGYLLDLLSSHRAAITNGTSLMRLLVSNLRRFSTVSLSNWSHEFIMVLHQLFRLSNEADPADIIPRSAEFVQSVISFVSNRTQNSDRVRFSMMDLVNPAIPPKLLLRSLPPLSHVNSMIVHQTVITLRENQLLGDALILIGQLGKYELAGQLWLQVSHSHPLPHGQTDYPGGPSELVENLITQLFHIESGIFEKPNVSSEKRRLILGSTYKDIHVCIGRIIGIAVRGGIAGPLLAQYVGPLDAESTVLNSIFFNSSYIRSGFYDIFFEGSLEYLFRNNTTRILEALSQL